FRFQQSPPASPPASGDTLRRVSRTTRIAITRTSPLHPATTRPRQRRTAPAPSATECRPGRRAAIRHPACALRVARLHLPLQDLSNKDRAMAMEASDIEALIRVAFPNATITITDLAGDGNHYAAEVVDESFRGLNRVQQQRAVYAAL